MKLKRIIAAICAVCTLSSLPVYAIDELSEEYHILEQIAEYVSELYIDESVTKEDAVKLAISGLLRDDEETMVKALKKMLTGLDPYSEYLTADEYNALNNDINNAFYGIGVVIKEIGDYVEIMGFTDNSPSEAAGVYVGDKITKVNGEDVKGKGLSYVREKIMGELGTSVEVTFIRDNIEYTAKITRAEVRGDTVFYEKLTDDIGYIQISDMGSNTHTEFADKIAQMRGDGVKKFILDLRNNGGGFVTSAVEIAKMIVPEGKIIDVVYRGREGAFSYLSDLKEKEFEIVTLVNENTASAAEILASALQESGGSVLYGDKTFGKGVIQQPYSLLNGSVIKITTGKYITRGGNEINEKGIEPDEYVFNKTVPINTKEYTQFDYKTKWDEGMSGEGVKAAKERLYLLRYFTGDTTNDNYDEEMKSIVARFQEENELYPYGVLDISTQVKIENKFAKLQVLHDKQFDAAFEALGGTVESE